jgi:hypothetical protein
VSDSVRPEIEAFRELDALVRHLGEELASFRRRALQAESRLKTLDETPAARGGAGGAELIERVARLEAENRELSQRLESASGRARHMLERVRFLRQQQERQAGGGGTDR